MPSFYTIFLGFGRRISHNVLRTYEVRGEAEHLGGAERSRMSAVRRPERSVSGVRVQRGKQPEGLRRVMVEIFRSLGIGNLPYLNLFWDMLSRLGTNNQFPPFLNISFYPFLYVMFQYVSLFL